MNTRIQRLMRLHRLCAEAGEGGSDAGGTGTADAATGTAGAAADAGTSSTLLTAEADPAGEAAAGADSAKKEGDPEGDAEKKPEGEEKKPPVGAPEEYADFKMPEGVAVDSEMADEFRTVAKELNLTQEQAQRMADLGARQAQKAAGANVEVIKQARAEWSASAAADKEFGGEGFKANMAYARKALDTFGTPELRNVLNGSGLGDHPEFIRFMYRTGKAISADTFVPGGAAKAPKTDAEVFYSSTTQGK